MSILKNKVFCLCNNTAELSDICKKIAIKAKVSCNHKNLKMIGSINYRLLRRFISRNDEAALLKK